MNLTPDLPMAQRFLDALGSPPWTFQTFDDRGEERTLARIYHGTLRDHARHLTDLNREGAGVFVMVNEGDCKGRSASNVTRVRALFVDQDNSESGPGFLPTGFKAYSQISVESSPDRYHQYWRVSGCQLDWFSDMQRALAKLFASDPMVHDLPRVMRLPGFWHLKDEPFQSRLIYCKPGTYNASELREVLPFIKSEPKPRISSDVIIGNGERNVRLTAIAGAFRHAGCTVDEIIMGLRYINDRRVSPPLRNSELRSIARSIGRYPIAPIEELEVCAMSDMIPLGGLWKNKSQNGTVYLSGYLGEAKILVFQVKEKKNDNSPDYKMMLAPKKRDSESQRSDSRQRDEPPPADDEIPF